MGKQECAMKLDCHLFWQKRRIRIKYSRLDYTFNPSHATRHYPIAAFDDIGVLFGPIYANRLDRSDRRRAYRFCGILNFMREEAVGRQGEGRPSHPRGA